MAQHPDNDLHSTHAAAVAWASGAREPYQALRYTGALKARSNTRRIPLKPAFALAVGLAMLVAGWSVLQTPSPAGSGVEWNQPSSPTSVRDLSSLTRGLRQNMPGGGERAPQKPASLQFRMPGKPPSERANGFSEPTETSGLSDTDAGSYG